MSYKINRLDDFGRGITFVNDKICFVNDALVDEEVDYSLFPDDDKMLGFPWKDFGIKSS